MLPGFVFNNLLALLVLRETDIRVIFSEKRQAELPFFYKLVMSFIFFTIVGTLSHEAGHLLSSKFFGFTGGVIHYGSTSYGHSPASDSLNFYRDKFQKELKNNIDFPEKKLIEKLEKSSGFRYACMAWGGPFQTMLTGTIGLIALILIRKRKRNQFASLTQSEWLWVFIALFWLRQAANCSIMFLILLYKGRYGRSDETSLSNYYDLPPWTLNVITGAIGTYVLYYVIFKFIPPPQRFIFILAGLVGGVLGYILWLEILGPIILP